MDSSRNPLRTGLGSARRIAAFILYSAGNEDGRNPLRTGLGSASSSRDQDSASTTKNSRNPLRTGLGSAREIALAAGRLHVAIVAIP